MKRLLALILAVASIFGVLALTSCGVKPEEDWENIQEKGKFVVGCTEFEPMNYYSDAAKKNLVGFDTEYAQAVADYLGVDVEFQMITWANKYMELEGGKIDAIWNGFTANSTDDDGVKRADKVDFPTLYATNYQCIVMKKSASFTTTAALSGMDCAVEGGSAGEAYAKTLTDEAKVVAKDAQLDAFTELKGDKVDFIVVDVLLAARTCGKGDYENYEIKFHNTTDPELYGIGCRKGSNFDEKIEEATKALVKNGKLQELALKYGVTLSPDVLALAD